MTESSPLTNEVLLSAYDLIPPIERFALPFDGLNNFNEGIHTRAGDFVLRTYTSPAYEDRLSIDYEHRLLAWLAKRPISFRVPTPISTRQRASLPRASNGWAALTPWLKGVQLDPADLDQLELLGSAIGELQTALGRYPVEPRPGRSLFGDLFRFPLPHLDPLGLTVGDLRVPPTPRLDELLAWWHEEGAALQTFVDGPYKALPTQVCHNDLTNNNILVDDRAISAVLDFEFATVTPRALDLAQGLRVALRVDEDDEPWEAARRLFHGYRPWIRLTEGEARLLPPLMRLRAAMPVLWWLGQPALGDPGRLIISRIERLRITARWLEQHTERLIDVALAETV